MTKVVALIAMYCSIAMINPFIPQTNTAICVQVKSDSIMTEKVLYINKEESSNPIDLAKDYVPLTELQPAVEIEPEPEPQEVEKVETRQSQSPKKYSAKTFKRDGVLHWNDYRWTWYSERVLPGGGLKIPGRHADESGYICDENDYICLASSTLAKGTVIDTPLGKQGKIYDSGCAAGTVDVYVNW